MRERAVRTRREPPWSHGRPDPELFGVHETRITAFFRNTAFTVHRPSDISLERTSPPPMVFTNHETRNTNHGLFIVCFDRRVVRNAGYQSVVKVSWKARRAPAVARRGVRRMAIRVISSDERQSRRPQMSVAQRVTRRFRSAARRATRHVPGTARRYANGAGARNAARVTFTTGCLGSRTI